MATEIDHELETIRAGILAETGIDIPLEDLALCVDISAHAMHIDDSCTIGALEAFNALALAREMSKMTEVQIAASAIVIRHRSYLLGLTDAVELVTTHADPSTGGAEDSPAVALAN